MAFHYSRRKLKAAEEAEAGELNIVPYLDILMNLIMFMLLSITGLATFGALNVTAPSYSAPSAAVTQDSDKPQLLLSVLISKRGFYVAGTGAVLGQPAGKGKGKKAAALADAPTIPLRADGRYDFAALTAKLEEIKRAYPTETKVILGAEPDVPYEELVSTMDAARETPGKQLLFPDVTLAAM